MKRLGVIDLGTNTFHLLISDYLEEKGRFIRVMRKRESVKLGDKGVKTINDEAFQRGLAAIKKFKRLVEKYKVDKLVAIGTAALRNASNAKEFMDTVKRQTGINVKLISGMEEAKLIHLGISSIIPIREENELIMDIGGGSIEFVICNNKNIFWAKSLPIGLSVLVNKIPFSEPVKMEELKRFNRLLDVELRELKAQLKKYPTKNIIGSSGTFEVIEQNISPGKNNDQYTVMQSEDFFAWYDKVIPTTYEQRLEMKEIPNDRADLVVYAFTLVKFVLDMAGIRKITTSPYALKEGTLINLVREEKS